MQTASLSVLFPLFGIMACGVAAGWFGLLKSSHSEILNRFVFSLSMPAFIFISLSRLPAAEFFNLPYLAALGSGMMGSMLIGFLAARWLFSHALGAAGIHGLCAMYSSTGYIGLPMLLLLFGDAALAPGVVGAVITGGLFLPMGILFAELEKSPQGQTNFFAPILAIARNPVIGATLAGLACSAFSVEVFAPVAKFCDLLGQAYIPCALFASGLFMAGSPKAESTKEVAWLLALKLIVHPALTYWIAVHLAGLDGMILAIVLLQAALPTGVPIFVLAQSYKIQVATTNIVVVFSTAISLITLSSLLFLLDL